MQTQSKHQPKRRRIMTFKPPRVLSFKANDVYKPFRTYGRLRPYKRGY